MLHGVRARPESRTDESVVRAARFAAFGIVALALVDRLPEMVKAGAPLATQVPTIEATPALRGLLL